MKNISKTKLTVLLGSAAAALVAGSLISFAAGGTYFTYVDNANNTNNLISPANSNSNTTPDNDMATGNLTTEPAPSVTFGATSPQAPIEFNINVNGASLPATTASLTIRAWDVDEEAGEQDDVYLNGQPLGKLTGANNVWSTTVFSISNPGMVVSGNNLVQVRIDTSGDPTAWVTAVRWGQILVDGGAANNASTGSVKIIGCQSGTAAVSGCVLNGGLGAGTVRIDTQATIQAVTAGDYRLEVSIVDPTGNSTSVLNVPINNVTANSTVVQNASPTYTLNSVSGTYVVQSQLFYIDANNANFPVQQDIATTTFAHTVNVGPADSDGDGILDAVEGTLDTDGDGTLDRLDTDSDNDGILDSAERGAGASPVDTDGDGLPDYRDLDTDNDGIPDVTEAGLVDVNRDGLLDAGSPTTSNPRSTDGDGVPDYRDLDDDADGLLDVVEAGGVDANTDGRIDGFTDVNGNGLADSVEPSQGGTPLPLPNSDNDANPNYIDTDSDGDGTADQTDTSYTNPCVPNANILVCPTGDIDGDGLTNGQEATLGTNPSVADTDGDGIADNVEVGGNVGAPVDTDSDGIIDALESNTVDTDGDGAANSADVDSDNDGIPDSVEYGSGAVARDTDGDGIADYLDRDSDNDSIPDALEAGATPATPVDSDNDGKADYLDRDSDDDGLPDLLEGGGSGADGDADGIDNAFDIDAQGGIDANHDGIADGKTTPDTDLDGVADFRDVDSDDDGILDTREANVVGQDTDADDLDDALDVDSTHGADINADGIDDAYLVPNTDADAVPDFRDLDADNDGITDVIEAGLVDDNLDGLQDVGGTPIGNPPDSDNDAVADFRDLDSNNDGTKDVAGTPNAALDANNDGRIDNLTDTDGDGLVDVVDAAPAVFGASIDSDGDGVSDAVDLDDDNDGIPDVQDGAGDADGDGIINALDRDSDNDGLTDTLEAGGVDANHDGVIDGFVDTNGNGLADSVEVALGGHALPLPDTDNDGQRDYVDIDSDGDGLNDIIESAGIDADHNGQVDSLTDADGDGLRDAVDGSVNGSVPQRAVDTDGDGHPDYVDVDSDNDGLADSQESTTDSDGDGIPDYRDASGKLETTLRGAGALEGWMLCLMMFVVMLRTSQLRRALFTVLMITATLASQGTAQAETAADHQGEWVVGGDIGLSHLKPRNRDGGYRIDDTSSTGYRLLVANQVWRDWSVEAFYTDAGEAGIASDNPAVGHLGSLSYKLFGAGTEWTPLLGGRGATFYPLLKGGLASTSNSASSNAIRYDKLNGVGFYIGVAAAWQFAPTWRAQLELISYDKDERMLTLGLRKSFGTSHSSPPVAAPAPVVRQPEPPPPATVLAAAPVDTDGDGVTDDADQCPDTPAGDKVDAKGCSLTIRLEVYFDTNSDRLKSESFASLDRVADFMQRVPEAKGELQGHTDNVGRAPYNLSLSQRRASAVQQYLVGKGVAAERLTARGYGSTQPVADNATVDGRAQNRRVLLVRTDVN